MFYVGHIIVVISGSLIAKLAHEQQTNFFYLDSIATFVRRTDFFNSELSYQRISLSSPSS